VEDNGFILINRTGGFFGGGGHIDSDTTRYDDGSDAFQAITLLHELGHVMNKLLPGDGGTSQQAKNNQIANQASVFDHCETFVKNNFSQ
jgi:hypothetical protein